MNGLLMLCKTPFYQVDCLRMGVEAKCLDFISHPAIQRLLTDIWYGKMKQKVDLKRLIYVI